MWRVQIGAIDHRALKMPRNIDRTVIIWPLRTPSDFALSACDIAMDGFPRRLALVSLWFALVGLSACVAADDDENEAPSARDGGLSIDSRLRGSPSRADASSQQQPGHSDSTLSCEGEQEACSGNCVDLSSNAQHCGECGNQCPAGGFFCSSGTCQCIGSGLKACGDKCVDTQSNAFHCGGCGRACPGGEICKQGQCEPLTEIEAIVRRTNEWRDQQVDCHEGTFSPTRDLEADEELHKAAQYHAESMARAGFFAHEQCGSPPQRACQACSGQECYGPGWRVETQASFAGSSAVGENIAKGQDTPKAAVQAWIDSNEGHCGNLMNDRWNRIGVGFATDDDGTPYWVQVFGVVE